MIELERQVNETLWYAIMLEPYQGDQEYNNEIFQIKPYSWADYDEDGEDPNAWHFWHKPSGLKIAWYKYPLRGIEGNMDITNSQFYAVLQDCMNSVPERNRPGLTIRDKTFKEWWNDK